MSRFDQRRAAKVRELGGGRPILAASLSKVRRRCGHPTCKCARGEPHQAYLVTYKVKGKTKSVHVPKELLPEVRAWVQEYQRVKQLLREISRLSLAIIHHHVPAARAAARGRTPPQT